MFVLAGFGTACGLALGLRHRVFALVPAHGVAALVTMAAAVGTGLTAGGLVARFMIWSVCCDVGFCAGAVLAMRVARSRAFRPRSGRDRNRPVRSPIP